MAATLIDLTSPSPEPAVPAVPATTTQPTRNLSIVEPARQSPTWSPINDKDNDKKRKAAASIVAKYHLISRRSSHSSPASPQNVGDDSTPLTNFLNGNSRLQSAATTPSADEDDSRSAASPPANVDAKPRGYISSMLSFEDSAFHGTADYDTSNGFHHGSGSGDIAFDEENDDEVPVRPSKRPRLSNTASPVRRSPLLKPSTIQQKGGSRTASRGVTGQYTPEENALLIDLKVNQQKSWPEIERHFPNRSRGSLQVHFSTKLKSIALKQVGTSLQKVGSSPVATRLEHPARNAKPAKRRKSTRDGGAPVTDGFVSWADIKAGSRDEGEREGRRRSRLRHGLPDVAQSIEVEAPVAQHVPFKHDNLKPRSFGRLLRLRELGSTTRNLPVEMVNHGFHTYRLRKTFSATCGDVNSLAWSPDARSKGQPLRFAAASIAISDDRNMQYNNALNLLVGDPETGILQELPEHHVNRPVVQPDPTNPNSLAEMQTTQDPRLFKTVNAVAFSSCGSKLFSAGDDGALRVYRVDREGARHFREYQHDAPVSLMAANSGSLVATASRSQNSSLIQICNLNGDKDTADRIVVDLGDSFSKALPSALHWGASYVHRNLLLAGFSGEADLDQPSAPGGTFLYNAESGGRVPGLGVTPDVFALAWNPSPTSTSTLFSVASKSAQRLNKGMRSAVHCFGYTKHGLKSVLAWECPALDIQELVHCPSDTNLFAAGATDGRVYVWDYRFRKRDQEPLQILKHGPTLNVIDHERDQELADTGVGFLSWGSTSSRLYSASSDGIVKMWNPYRNTEDAHVSDVARLPSAIMSGAFSPDHRDLLIGEESGRLNLLSLDFASGPEGMVDQEVKVSTFKLRSAPEPTSNSKAEGHEAARLLLDSEQIVIRPLGGLPVRQAVQGPEYSGPFFKPSKEERHRVRNAYEEALSKVQQAERDNLEGENHDIDALEKRYQIAKTEILAVKARKADWPVLKEQAAAAREYWLSKEPKSDTVKTHSARTQALNIPRGEITVNDQSRERVPGRLLTLRPQDIQLAALTCYELYHLGLADKCKTCPVAANSRSTAQKKMYEATCKNRRNQIIGGLNAVCGACSFPMHSSEEDPREFCERCQFRCIRCSQPAELSKLSAMCFSCEISWRVGVLGYDVEEQAGRRKRDVPDAMAVDEEGDEDDEFGLVEIEHYMSRCTVNQNGDD